MLLLRTDRDAETWCMHRDRAAARLLSGGAELPLVVITTRLLTEVHGMLIRLLQVMGPFN